MNKQDTKKYLREAGFDKILRDLFLDSVDRNGAILKSKRILLYDLSAPSLDELRKYLQRFKTIEWCKAIK